MIYSQYYAYKRLNGLFLKNHRLINIGVTFEPQTLAYIWRNFG